MVLLWTDDFRDFPPQCIHATRSRNFPNLLVWGVAPNTSFPQAPFAYYEEILVTLLNRGIDWRLRKHVLHYLLGRVEKVVTATYFPLAPDK